MFRLAGFVSGVTIAVVVLAAVVDAPTRDRAGVLVTTLASAMLDAVDPSSSPDAIDTSYSSVLPPDLRISEPDLGESTVAEETQPVVEPHHRDAKTPTDDLAASESVFGAVPQPEKQATPIRHKSAASGDTSLPDGHEWQPVWDAFRSELSAKGFARRLKHLTGQQYRVRRTSSRVYQVELAYADVWQRDAVLREIQTKTGLGLMEMQP